jgi:WD40 repeat protein
MSNTITNQLKLKIHKQAQLTGHNASIYALAKGTEEGIFYSAGGDGWLVRWSVDEPELGQLVAKTESKIFSIGIFPHLDLMAAGNMEGGLHWIDLKGNKDVKNVAHHEQGIFSIIQLDDNFALTGGGMGRLTKWNLATLQSSETLHLTNTSIRSIHKKGDKILVGASDNHIYMLNKDLEIMDVMENAHDNSVFAAVFYPNNNQIVSGGRDALLKLWNEDKRLVEEKNAHWFTINDIKFSPDGTIFATASRDKTIRLWDSQKFKLIKELNHSRDGGHLNSVNRLLWLDNNTLVSASDDRSIIIWTIENT